MTFLFFDVDPVLEAFKLGGFREFVRREAVSLQLTGYVRRWKSKSSVFVEIEGTSESVDRFFDKVKSWQNHFNGYIGSYTYEMKSNSLNYRRAYDDFLILPNASIKCEKGPYSDGKYDAQSMKSGSGSCGKSPVFNNLTELNQISR